jgi:hypothetical protein
MRARYEIHGYAIVSDDDRIADAAGEVPPALRNEKDWAQYQAALARSDLVVFARKSHENEPDTHGRTRMVMSRQSRGLEQRDGAWWWNPAEVAWTDALARVLPEGGEVAAPGGQGVFDLFLGIGYARRQAAGRAKSVFGMRRGSVGGDGSGPARAAPRRDAAARSGEGRGDEYLEARLGA